jgi:hypothetical protein
MVNSRADKIRKIVSEAIAHRLGDIGALPEVAQDIIRSAYQAFFTAYLEILRIKSRHEKVEFEDLENLDAEVLEYMQHFFSDYQRIFRQFNVLNRQARTILTINREKYPQEYQEHLKALLSDNHEFNNESIFKEILQLAQTDH